MLATTTTKQATKLGGGSRATPRAVILRAQQQASNDAAEAPSQQSSSRREALLQQLALAGAAALLPAAAAPPPAARAAGLPPPGPQKMICDEDCARALDAKGADGLVTTPSGLQYREITEGTGPQAEVGYQAVVHYVAMLPNGRVFENSLERGAPFDVRIGTGQVVPGLDEALTSMRVGGVRRVYVPGPLAFPKPLKAAAGRPSVPANSPLVFDVQLLYIPGLDD